MDETAREPASGWTPGMAKMGWLIIALALVLRLVWLGIKPPHFDEGVNGWFVDQMTRQGYYHYDPGNYHGPFHFYVMFLAQTLFGRSVVALRVPLVLINVATIWLVLQFRRFMPGRACLLAALALAVSPGMLFYSRYAIHEAWLVFAMVLALWGVAEMTMRGSAHGLWSAIMGLTLMVLTKETYIIHLVSFALAWGVLLVLERWSPSAPGFPLRPVPQRWRWTTLCQAVCVALLAILFFYSGGFLDPSSLRGLFQTFADWFHTGMESEGGHEKVWYYWLELMGIYEWPAAVGLLYCVRALFPGMNRVSRFLAIYGCGTLAAYSIVKYKTPWCIISLLWPFLFLFGDAIDSLARWRKWQAVRGRMACAAGVSVLTLGGSLAIAARLNYYHPTDPKEKYVYVQTLNDLFKLTEPLQKLVALDPTAYHMRGNILLSSYHPLPWVLGDFTSIGYYDSGKPLPEPMDAALLIIEEDQIDKAEPKLRERYFVDPFQLRDGMPGGKLYLNYERFRAVFPGRKPDLIPAELPSPADAEKPSTTPAVSPASSQ